MSAFGDRTPKQELLESLESLKSDHDLSLLELIQVIAEVLSYITEYWKE